jgi:peptidoglycan/LPS O-acetylase OafA/YrhL
MEREVERASFSEPARLATSGVPGVSGVSGVSGVNKKAPAVMGHMPALDGVRGLAILMVLVVHFIAGTQATNPFEAAVNRVAGFGMFGVDLFFVLSGFLITGILLDSKRPGGYLAYFRNFYMRRSLRIFPLYYGVLFCLFAVAPLVPFLRGPELESLHRDQLWAWFYLVNVFIWRNGAYGLPYIDHFWSLAVEEHFYFFWPLIVWLCPRRALVRVSLLVALASFVARALLAPHANPIGLYVLTPFRLDSLCLGGLLAACARGPGGIAALGRAVRPMTGIALVVLIGSYTFNHFSRAGWAELHELRSSTFEVLFGALVVQALVASRDSLFGRFFNASAMRFLGKYSYGLYVFHHFFSYYFSQHHTEFALASVVGSHTLAVYLQASFGLLVSLGVAMLSFRFYEKPFLALKRYWPSGDGAHAAGGAGGDPPGPGADREAIVGGRAEKPALTAVPETPPTPH